jgi:WD40 repeat protein
MPNQQVGSPGLRRRSCRRSARSIAGVRRVERHARRLGSGQRPEIRSWSARQGPVTALAISNGRRLTSVSGDCTLKLWDLNTTNAIAAFTMAGSGRSYAYGTNGLIVSGDKSGRLYFFAWRLRRSARKLSRGPSDVSKLACLADHSGNQARKASFFSRES